MFSPSAIDLRSNPELRCLYEITRLRPPQANLQEYFHEVMAILSEYFPIAYSALLLHHSEKDFLHVEALYGLGREGHPQSCSGQKGIIFKVLESRQPMAIQNLSYETLYEEMTKGPKRIEKIRAPLVCIPLIAENEPIGVLNINSLYGPRNEFAEDFMFLSTLSAILSPIVRNYQVKKNEPLAESGKRKSKSSVLDEILEEKLAEVLNKIDPYVESKTRMGIYHDIIALVEKILIKSALRRVDHVQVAASEFLGINRNTLRKKMKELKIKAR